MAFSADCRQELTIELVTDDIEVNHSNIIGPLMEVAFRHILRSTPPNGKTRSVSYTACETRKRLQRIRSSVDAEEYRSIKGVTQKIIKDAQNASWREYCSCLIDRTKLWQVWGTLSLSGARSRPAIPTLKKDSVNYTTNKEKAELLGKYFSGVSSNRSHSVEFQERKSAFEDDHSDELHGGQLPADGQPFNEPFTINALRIALSRCKKNTSPGRIPSPLRSWRSSRIQAFLPCWNCLTGCGPMGCSRFPGRTPLGFRSLSHTSQLTKVTLTGRSHSPQSYVS